MSLNKIVAHLDMDSFFATVEQQANPRLRGKAIVVSGKEGSRSVIVASSKEAKKLGIKTGMLHFEARKLCPDLCFVEPDGDKYNTLHHRIVESIARYVPNFEVFSIDELFLDFSACRNFSEAINLAKKIKLELKKVLGSWLTCSVGIAENKLMAKLASDLKKPDGIMVVDESNLETILSSAKLKDFCGVGCSINARLDALGIDSVLKLREYPQSALLKEFGPVGADFLFHLARGQGQVELASAFEKVQPQSVGRSYTLAKNTSDKVDFLSVLAQLIEQVVVEMRRQKLSAKRFLVYLRYADFSGKVFSWPGSSFGFDGEKIFFAVQNTIDNFVLPKMVRLVGVRAENLIPVGNQQSLWEKDRKKLSLLTKIDEINRRYGDFVIKPAYLLKTTKMRRHVGGFKLYD